MLWGRDIGNKKDIKYMTFYRKCNALIEIVAFLLRPLLAVTIFLSFDERILLLNKEHSRSKNWLLKEII